MFKVFKESQRRHGPWHIAVFLMLGIGLGILGLYYLLSKKLIYCPVGDTDAVFHATADERMVLSRLGGLAFRFPANATVFRHNQTSGSHKWLIFHGLLPGLQAYSEKIGITKRNKLDDCDFYVKDKVVIAVVQQKPRPRWADRGGIDQKNTEALLDGTTESAGPHGLRAHHAEKLKDHYDNYPFQKTWLYSHKTGQRQIFFYCWRDKIGSRGCYTQAAPLAIVPTDENGERAGIAMKYFFHRDDLKRWREIDREARALVRSFYEAGSKQP